MPLTRIDMASRSYLDIARSHDLVIIQISANNTLPILAFEPIRKLIAAKNK